MATEKRYIDVFEASELTGISVSTLRRGVNNGRFTAHQSGTERGKFLFDRKVLLRVLQDEALGKVKDKEQRSYLASLFDKDEDDENITPPSATFTP